MSLAIEPNQLFSAISFKEPEALITKIKNILSKSKLATTELFEAKKHPELTNAWTSNTRTLCAFIDTVKQLKIEIHSGEPDIAEEAETELFEFIVPQLKDQLAEVRELCVDIALKLFHETSTNLAPSPNRRRSPVYPFSPEHIARYARSPSLLRDLTLIGKGPENLPK